MMFLTGLDAKVLKIISYILTHTHTCIPPNKTYRIKSWNLKSHKLIICNCFNISSLPAIKIIIKMVVITAEMPEETT